MSCDIATTNQIAQMSCKCNTYMCNLADLLIYGKPQLLAPQRPVELEDIYKRPK